MSRSRAVGHVRRGGRAADGGPVPEDGSGRRASLRVGGQTAAAVPGGRAASAQSVDDIAVVLGEGVDELAPLIPDDGRVRTVWNARHAAGRSGSVIIGTLALRRSQAVMFCNVDQPLSTSLVEDFLRGAGDSLDFAIAVAMNGGRRGHPVLIRRALFPEVVSISESSEGLKAVIRKDPARVLTVPVDSPNALLGFNTPDEYDHVPFSAWSGGNWRRTKPPDDLVNRLLKLKRVQAHCDLPDAVLRVSILLPRRRRRSRTSRPGRRTPGLGISSPD